MYTYVVLRQPKIGELIFGVPTPGQRRVILVHHRVQVLQPVLSLLSERAGRPGVSRGTAAAATASATAVRAHHRRVAAVRAGRRRHVLHGVGYFSAAGKGKGNTSE